MREWFRIRMTSHHLKRLHHSIWELQRPRGFGGEKERERVREERWRIPSMNLLEPYTKDETERKKEREPNKPRWTSQRESTITGQQRRVTDRTNRRNGPVIVIRNRPDRFSVRSVRSYGTSINRRRRARQEKRIWHEKHIHTHVEAREREWSC